MSFSVFSEKPSYLIHKSGYITSAETTAEVFEPALKYIPEKDDIFIATYPKCGTTWVLNILHLMKNFGQPLASGQNISQFISHLEEDGIDAVINLPRPRIIKTHLPFWLVPKSNQAKYIYIARNPKDCCVSFYHHTKGFKCYYNFEDGTFDEYFELFLQGKVDCGDYFEHLLSWIEHKNDSNVLFLLYEDMKSNIVECLKLIGKFIGGSFKEAIEDSNSLERILMYSSFDVMKQDLLMWASRRPEQLPFIRKGKVGDWRNYFSDEQIRKIDEKCKMKLSGTEAELLWKNYDC